MSCGEWRSTLVYLLFIAAVWFVSSNGEWGFQFRPHLRTVNLFTVESFSISTNYIRVVVALRCFESKMQDNLVKVGVYTSLVLSRIEYLQIRRKCVSSNITAFIQNYVFYFFVGAADVACFALYALFEAVLCKDSISFSWSENWHAFPRSA